MHFKLERGAEPIPGYQLIDLLGRGGFGEVWKAHGPGGFEVALKFVPLVEQVGPVELRALQVIRHIRHPHLLSTFGSWEVDGHLIIAMELAERTLMDHFRDEVRRGSPGIPAPEIYEHFLDAAKGLDYLNEPRHSFGGEEPQGIQHRDVKPQNLLLIGGSVKVADFGLARVLEHSQTSHTGSMTAAYAAPEFFDRKTSSQSDQYSLAVTYCHLRGGRLPFTGSPMEVMSGHLMRPPDLTMLPEVERPIVERALAKVPKERWPSCRHFIAELSSTSAGSSGVRNPAQVSTGAISPSGSPGSSRGAATEDTVLPSTATDSPSADSSFREETTALGRRSTSRMQSGFEPGINVGPGAIRGAPKSSRDAEPGRAAGREPRPAAVADLGGDFGSAPPRKLAPRTSRKAIASLVLGLFSILCLCFTGIPAVVLGALGLLEVERSRGFYKGKGMAIAGILLGSFGCLLGLIAVLAGLLHTPEEPPPPYPTSTRRFSRSWSISASVPTVIRRPSGWPG
jgi:serine/threonine protein kinase